MELDRKAFHFDLDNKSVERFYTGKKNPWSDIQDFLESHCFEKPQYSGYESAENIVMSYQRAYGTVDKMMDKFPWFHRCVKAATFTEIGESYDVKEFLENGLQLSLPLRPETRKELHFDLGTAALSENYNSMTRRWPSWRNCNKDILGSRIPFSPRRSPRSASATMPSPISRVPMVSSFRFPPIRLSVRSRISSVPKSVI